MLAFAIFYSAADADALLAVHTTQDVVDFKFFYYNFLSYVPASFTHEIFSLFSNHSRIKF